MVYKADTEMYTGSGRIFLRPVAMLLVLPCTEVLVVGGYKQSREGTDPRSLVDSSDGWMGSVFWGVLFVVVVFRGLFFLCVSRAVRFSPVPPWRGPFLPFYNTEGEGSGYNCGFVATGKEEREKDGVGMAVLLLPIGNSPSCCAG